MADTKISALPSATTPLAGTEVLPIVQGGVTEKVAVDDLTVKNVRSNATSGILQITGPTAATTRVMTTPDANFTAARTDAAQSFTGDQTLSTGNLVIGTAGKGIDFSADPSAAGMTSELLDDYEEGTWTPNLTFATPGDRTLSEQVGFYTKVGNVVHVSGAVTVVKGTGSGAATITGLPFQTNSNGNYVVPVTIVANTAGSLANSVVAYILPGATTISLLLSPQSIAGLAALTAAEMAASATFRFTASYQI